MTTPDRTLGVAVCGTGWCAAQHISAFQKNPQARVTWICGRDVERARVRQLQPALQEEAALFESHRDGAHLGRAHDFGRT